MDIICLLQEIEDYKRIWNKLKTQDITEKYQ